MLSGKRYRVIVAVPEGDGVPAILVSVGYRVFCAVAEVDRVTLAASDGYRVTVAAPEGDRVAGGVNGGYRIIVTVPKDDDVGCAGRVGCRVIVAVAEDDGHAALVDETLRLIVLTTHCRVLPFKEPP